MEMMERDRALASRSLSKLEISSQDWVFFIAEILEWLDLRGDYDDYVQDPRYPWPHSFIVQDIVQAFAMIAMFIPDSNVTKLVTMFVNSSQCDEFRKSGVFDPKERSKVRPDRRTRTSYKFRDKELWKEWKEFYTRVTDYICLTVMLVKTQLSIEPTIYLVKDSFHSALTLK
ncbi:hypothetical protein FOBRF1_001711 [Fusarium oxysporum]